MTELDQLKPGVPFTLEEYKAFVQEMKILKFNHSRATGQRKFGEAARLNSLLLKDLPPIYRSKLPTCLLARCPICNGQVTEPVDTFSLSGTGWWISESRGFGWLGRAHRYVTDLSTPLGGERFREPSYEAECQHVRAVCYGVNLNNIIPDDIKPIGWVIVGSEKPGVLVPFMEQEGSFAVIHTLPVGRLDDVEWQPHYTAYFVTYCNADPDAYLKSLAPRDPYDYAFLWPYDWMDYDLEGWVKAGKLFWLGLEADGRPLRQEPVDAFPHSAMDGLIGRWAADREKGACLLPDVSPKHLGNRRSFPFARIEPLQEKALSERNFRSIRREQVERALQLARQRGHRPHPDTDLARMDLSGMDLSGAILRKKALYDTNLSRANLQDIDGTGINLHGANLSEADLSGADLDEAYAVGADLSKANLRGTSLRGANLSEASLKGADLSGCDLGGADVTEVRFYGARYDERTRWPDGFTPHF